MNTNPSALLFALMLLAPVAATQGDPNTPSAPPETVSPAVAAATGTSNADEITFKATWKNGLQFKSSDGATKIQLGGRLYNDWAWFSADQALDADVGPFVNGTEMRSARIYIKGTINERYFFKANYDFGDSKLGDGGPGFKDVYMGLNDLPGVQNVQVGHMKEPFGLEQLTSSKYITFMERSISGGTDPKRNTGMMAFGTALKQRSTYAIGAFRDSDKFGLGTGDGAYNFTGRVTGLPVTNSDHTSMIHLGLAASYKVLNGGMLRYRPRPESHLAPRYLDTGNIAADSQNLIGLEWASVTGPFYTQAEYVTTMIDGAAGGPSPTFGGFYGQVSWFVTGETKKYLPKKGAFGRVKPKNPWGNGGSGAWELALRYSTLDLNDSGVTGGEMSTVTGGVNWYLSSFARVMTNYLYTDKKDVGTANIFQVRFQIDF